MKESLKVHEILRAHELKVTTFREELLQLFLAASAPLSAAQIFERLKANRRLRKTRFDRATLFRNLKILEEKGVLSATDFGTGRAFYCLGDTTHHHHHVYCVSCETVRPIRECTVDPMIDQAHTLGFKILSHKLEILGLCAECR